VKAFTTPKFLAAHVQRRHSTLQLA
jgi:hypothetical protein